jgi:PAS domain S-box-containing protein
MKMNDYKTALDAHAIAEVTDDERKRVESKLKESEIRYRRLFERSKDGILILDAETGQIEDVNPFLIEMLGYTHDEFLGRKLWEMGVFKDIADSQSAFRDLQRHEFTRDEDLLLEASDGRRICVEFISTVYVVDDKKSSNAAFAILRNAGTLRRNCARAGRFSMRHWPA